MAQFPSICGGECRKRKCQPPWKGCRSSTNNAFIVLLPGEAGSSGDPKAVPLEKENCFAIIIIPRVQKTKPSPERNKMITNSHNSWLKLNEDVNYADEEERNGALKCFKGMATYKCVWFCKNRSTVL